MLGTADQFEDGEGAKTSSVEVAGVLGESGKLMVGTGVLGESGRLMVGTIGADADDSGI